ncbi:MAG: hypothetical protein JNL82_36445 [Myxococcales bacterium]|nr:hypothetical protein [Myxococcales bacterium]
MNSPQGSPHQELVSVFANGFRVFQRRRDQRRAYAAEVYGAAAPAPATSPMAAAPQRPPPEFSEVAPDASPFRPGGFVDMNGRAIQVMDPATLQRLQELEARGMMPPELLAALLSAAPVVPATAVDPQAASAVNGFRNPPGPPPANPGGAAATDAEVKADTAGGPTDPWPSPKADPPPDQGAQAGDREEPSDPHPVLDLLEQFLARRADEEAARLGALHREHEARLAQQAESAAKLQTTLFREVLDSHRAELNEQATRHAQVVRDLLREHQCQLDERTMAAVTREAQAIGTLLREHRDALAETNEAHRRGLEEILEHHQGELQAAHETRSGDAKLHAFLAEQVKLQREAFTSGLASLGTKLEQFGLAVRQLAEKVGDQRPDLSWLPPPPSFVPPLPELPGAGAPAVEVPSAPPTIRNLPSRQVRPAVSRPDPSRERDSVHAFMDDIPHDTDNDYDAVTDVDDEMTHHLRPLTPLSAHP